MKVYAVLDNYVPAIRKNTEWSEYMFKTIEEAYEYADAWLGQFGPFPRGETEYNYSGADDKIIILEIDTREKWEDLILLDKDKFGSYENFVSKYIN